MLMAKHYLNRSSHCLKATSGEASLHSMSTTPTQALQASGAHWEAVASLMPACWLSLAARRRWHGRLLVRPEAGWTISTANVSQPSRSASCRRHNSHWPSGAQSKLHLVAGPCV